MVIEQPPGSATITPLPSDDVKHDVAVIGQDINDVDAEEGKNAYRHGGFHPVYISDIYGGKYQVVNKIRYGVYSTVWLVKDTSKE